MKIERRMGRPCGCFRKMAIVERLRSKAPSVRSWKRGLDSRVVRSEGNGDEVFDDERSTLRLLEDRKGNRASFYLLKNVSTPIDKWLELGMAIGTAMSIA